MASATYHEPIELLSGETREMHRAIVSLMEELEAIDWYQQRADACSDPQLKNVLLHNKNEEIEHASMVIEWTRRHNDHFNEMMRRYLFTEQPITGMNSEAKWGQVVGNIVSEWTQIFGLVLLTTRLIERHSKESAR